MLELAILDKEGNFLGSLEVFGLNEDIPEVGIWLKKDCHGLGYGFEALEAGLNYLCDNYKFKKVIYEVDIRNNPSINLVNKFVNEKKSCTNVTTKSGKQLILQTYIINMININKIEFERNNLSDKQIPT